MEFVYFLEVGAGENRSNKEVFKLIKEMATPEERVFSDTDRANRTELKQVLSIANSDDILLVRSVKDVVDTTEELANFLSRLESKRIELYSCEEPFLNGKCAYSMFTGVRGLEQYYKEKKKKEGYQKALSENRVGRPKKSKAIERALRLYEKGALSVSDIALLTGVSRTTLYKHLKNKK